MNDNEKFIQSFKVNDLQVDTPNGWIDIQAIGKTVLFDEWEILLSNGRQLICADLHIVVKCIEFDFRLKKCSLQEVYCKDLQIGDWLMTRDGPEMVLDLKMTSRRSHMYDLQIDEGSNHHFWTNGILSHNSLWMQNFAVKSADMGQDVLYITLEMNEKKVMKRLGAMRLKIEINSYDEISKNTDFIKKRIDSLAKQKTEFSHDLFQNPVGKIIVKFWAAGTATINDIDLYLTKLYEKRGIKPKLVIVDYITLIAPQRGVQGDNLYSKGKHLAEGLRAIAAKHMCPVITGIQVSKDAWNANDITLDQVPESKAIAETADTFFAIIRTEEMKRQNLYRFKLLKQRDGDFLKSQLKMNLNPKYLTLENDQFLDSI